MPTILEPQPSNPDVRTLQRIVALENRISAIERNGAMVPITTGTPGAGQGRDGSLAGDTTLKLWLKINGTWRSVAVV